MEQRQDGQQEPYRVGYLLNARQEAKKALSDEQYAYAVRMARRLQDWSDPLGLCGLRIEQVDGFYELKLKGNVLGKTNLRIFFAVFDKARTVVVLGVHVKEEEGQLPRQVVLRMKNRHRVVAQDATLAIRGTAVGRAEQ